MHLSQQGLQTLLSQHFPSHLPQSHLLQSHLSQSHFPLHFSQQPTFSILRQGHLGQTLLAKGQKSKKPMVAKPIRIREPKVNLVIF